MKKASLRADVSLSAVVAGFMAVLVAYGSALVIIFQAAEAAGATADMMGSWVLALGVGNGVLSIGLCWYYKKPITIAWSTTGAALLATSLHGQALSDVMGAFIFAAVLTIAVGLSGWFNKLMVRVPMAIAAAMLAGVLLNFGVATYTASKTQPLLVGIMFFAYILARRLVPGYAVIVLLASGILATYGLDLFQWNNFNFALAQPVWVTPTVNWSVIIGIGVPLFVVTMTSQNVTGLTVLRTSGYDVPVSTVVTHTGIISLLLAPIGGYSFCMAAVTATLCTTDNAHPDKGRRYIAGISWGVFNILVGIAGGTIIALLASFPKEMVSALAGLALLSAISGALYTAVGEDKYREAAMITFMVTISGVQFFDIASAFWGGAAGLLTHIIFNGFRSSSAGNKVNKDKQDKR
jgi:benzoate membrane transport protein